MERLEVDGDYGLVARTLYQLWRRGVVERPEAGLYGLGAPAGALVAE